ncbi:vWA domain-containing protein [Marinospirillum sp. MEB164]|uniref:VWA domain-containing protein n=1 Tax=Marinospirillum alkalitolerans TaxID=3123374 RepID=A0ABW8PUF6_9GAMM
MAFSLRLMLLCLLLGLLRTPALAQTPDIRLVVDISGSMHRTDPNNLRIPATHLLIDLLPEGGRAGIWTFGAYVNMLVPHGQVNEAWRRQAALEAEKINSVALFTDIENALERATWDAARPAAHGPRHIILLSDGLVDISEAATVQARERENQQSRDIILRQMLPRLVEAGFQIHTLALSDEADHDLMATLAQRSGGLHAIAHTADDLMPFMLQILNRTLPAEEVPLIDNRFLIDPTINEFTALVFHPPGAELHLLDPQGRRFGPSTAHPNVRWYGNANYTLVTVTGPQAGQWQIETEAHPDNRVTVVSDVQFHTSSIPSTLFRGDQLALEAWLTEEGRPVDRREFLRLLNVEARLIKSGQTLLAQPLLLDAQRPRYGATLDTFPELGEQQLQVDIDGRTFRRQISHSVNVQDVVAASVQLPEDGSAARLILRAQHPALRRQPINFTVTASGQPLSAVNRGDGEWRVDLASLPRDVAHSIQVHVSTQLNGRAVNVTLPEVLLPIERRPARVMPEPAPVQATPPPAAAPAPASVAEPEAAETAPSWVPAPPPLAVPILPLPESQPAAEASTSPEVAAESVVDAAADREKVGLFDPIESWDDPRMLWIYLALAIANILLFAVAFLMYRRFINKRREKAAQQQDETDFDDLPDLDDALDGLDDDEEPR